MKWFHKTKTQIVRQNMRNLICMIDSKILFLWNVSYSLQLFDSKTVHYLSLNIIFWWNQGMFSLSEKYLPSLAGSKVADSGCRSISSAFVRNSFCNFSCTRNDFGTLSSLLKQIEDTHDNVGWLQSLSLIWQIATQTPFFNNAKACHSWSLTIFSNYQPMHLEKTTPLLLKRVQPKKNITARLGCVCSDQWIPSDFELG